MLVAKGPQPVRLAVVPPTGLVAMQDGRVQRFLLNLFVPAVQQLLQPLPHLHQTAGSDLELQVKVEHLDDLRERVPQGVMQPRRERQHAIAQQAPRQSGGHWRLDLFAALRAPIAVDRMFGRLRLHVWNVFGVADAGLREALEARAAVGAAIGAMLDLPVDTFGRWSSRTGMPTLAAGPLLAATLGRRLLVHRNHPRGSRGGRPRTVLLLRLGQPLAHFQQREHNRFFPLLKQTPRLRLGQLAAAKCLQRRSCGQLCTRCHTPQT